MRKGMNKMALHLFEHNKKAYHAAVPMVEQYGSAAIAPPGKSYITFKLGEELFDGHIANEMTLGEAIVRGILPTPNGLKWGRNIKLRMASGLVGGYTNRNGCC